MHAADISVNYGSKLRFKWLSSSKQHESSLDPLVRVNDAESWMDLKPDNLQYNTLVPWFAGTNDLLTKHLMYQ